MNKYKIKIQVEGPCSKCGAGASIFVDVQVDENYNSIELKSLLSKKQEDIIKEISSILCDECFMSNKFGLPPNLVQEIITSSSSEGE